MRNDELSESDLTEVLRFAVLFLRSDDELVTRFGYRILLQYTSVTGDYEPLRSVAMVKELMPIVAAAERLSPGLVDPDELASALFAAHRTNFETRAGDGTTTQRTRGQMELRSFNGRVSDAVVVAPTSYGKSEMLIDKLAGNIDRATCVIVPTRALIAQTRAALVADPRIRESRVRIVTHPDAYVGDVRFIAVLTQERLQRLFVNEQGLSLDLLLIDEAHNLLSGDSRSVELSQVTLMAQARNEAMTVTFYTPFLAVPSDLRHVNSSDRPLLSKTVNEHVKAEKLIHAPLGERQRLYDQFLNRTIELDDEVPDDEVAAVVALAGHRTLAYVNRPREAQELAERLSSVASPVVLSSRAAEAVQAIADLIDPNYGLIDCIRAGVLFHHGKVPDLLRQYIERLFREDRSEQPRFLVTTSTLLEGVNTPADCLILMSASRGRGYLTRSAFRNLIGRVGRFREVFDSSRQDLDLLQPKVYLMPSSYSRKGWNVEDYLSRVADLAKSADDNTTNPLLEASADDERRQDALVFLENVEPGSSGLANSRRAQTEVGLLCFLNGVRDFDILEHEADTQERVEEQRLLPPVGEVGQLIDVICGLFLEDRDLMGDELSRVRDNDGARRFYSLFLGWRSNNEPYKRMIAHFMRYWSQLNEELVYVGSSWGDETFGDEGFRRLYVRMSSKSRAERINLAVAKVKEEQDFIDFNLMRYVEILNTLGLLEGDLYSRVKYGTADPYLICLLKNGLSPELARLIQDVYRDHVAVEIETDTITVYESLPTTMTSGGENDILIYEAETMVSESASETRY